MTDGQRLTLVRSVHTAIYLVMAGSVFVVLYAGITGVHGAWLWVAAGLVAVEWAGHLVRLALGLRVPRLIRAAPQPRAKAACSALARSSCRKGLASLGRLGSDPAGSSA